MKFPNYLISSLAIVGAFSLIIMACSADDANVTNNTTTTGRYQITGGAQVSTFHVIDTETGVVKSYQGYNNSDFILTATTITQ
jgi:hypothetical protein